MTNAPVPKSGIDVRVARELVPELLRGMSCASVRLISSGGEWQMIVSREPTDEMVERALAAFFRDLDETTLPMDERWMRRVLEAALSTTREAEQG